MLAKLTFGPLLLTWFASRDYEEAGVALGDLEGSGECEGGEGLAGGGELGVGD